MLEIKNISKSFGNYAVLKQCSLSVEKGSIFGLVGINGAGKSTLLRTIAGVYEADEGVVLFDGHDTHLEDKVRKDILLIADDPYFEKHTTIETMKDYYRSFYDFDELIFDKYLKMFGLNPKKALVEFSKGMKRQAFLLFALAIKPKLLLLDEAFDGLDPLIRYNFKKALAELIEDYEITVIISSHNLKELEDICDSFGILENGYIKTSGDLNASKDMINKYQLAYDHEVSLDIFNNLDIMSSNISGRVITLVIKGDVEEVKAELMATNPIILDVLAINFEELFIYEVESRGMLDE